MLTTFLTRRKETKNWRKICTALIVGLSDTQAITSIAYAIPTLTRMQCTVSAYHYILIWYLCSIASACYLSSALAAHQLSRHTLPTIVRFILTYTLLGCTTALWLRRRTAIFPVYAPLKAVDPPKDYRGQATGLVLPAICFRAHPFWNSTAATATNARTFGGSELWASEPGFKTYDSSEDNLKSRYDLTCFLILVVCAWMTLLLYGMSFTLIFLGRHRSEKWRRRFEWPRIYVSGFNACFAIVLIGWSAQRFKFLQLWMNNSGWFGGESEVGLQDSYGQWIPMFLIILPVLAGIEAFSERK